MGHIWYFRKLNMILNDGKKWMKTIQELWIGRSKGTGLLLGTLSKDEDRKLAVRPLF